MSDFTPSISIINDCNDLEIVLNEYEQFLRETYKNDNLLEYQWRELCIRTNDIIENIISMTPTIHLKISNIKKQKFREDIDFSTNFENNYWKIREYKTLRGDDLFKKWTKLSYEETINEKEIYIITYDLPKIHNSQLGPFNTKGQKENSVPIINFKTYTDKIDETLKVGSDYLFNLNSVKITRYLGKGEIIFLYYFENYLKPQILEKSNSNSNSNSNCFIVTTTMGDINHPVVVDFRRYRDEVLLNTYFGRVFINIYYKVGPVLSKVIKNNSLLFTISKKLVLSIHKLIKN